MHWLSILFIGIASNLDNLGIGVSFGIRSTKIPFISNLIIAVVSMFAAFFSITMGRFISSYIPPDVANFSGGLFIISIGVWTASTVFFQKEKEPIVISSAYSLSSVIRHPTTADKDRNRIISWKESVSLGFALALNCMASGFGAGVSGISPLSMTIVIGTLSLITVDLGLRIGYKAASTWFGKYSNILAGLMLIGIGIYEIIN